MKDTRRLNQPLTIGVMIDFIRMNFCDWLSLYIKGKKDSSGGYLALQKLLRYFARLNGFSRKRVCKSRRSAQDLEETRNQFAANFWEQHWDISLADIFNVDETGIFYDMPPKYIWTERGTPAAIEYAEKGSGRMTAVLTVAVNGNYI